MPDSYNKVDRIAGMFFSREKFTAQGESDEPTDHSYSSLGHHHYRHYPGYPGYSGSDRCYSPYDSRRNYRRSDCLNPGNFDTRSGVGPMDTANLGILGSSSA